MPANERSQITDEFMPFCCFAGVRASTEIIVACVTLVKGTRDARDLTNQEKHTSELRNHISNSWKHGITMVITHTHDL